MTDLLAWVRIYGNKHATLQIVHYAEEKLMSKDTLVYLNYVPCLNERLEDNSTLHRSSKANITLFFLLKEKSLVTDFGKKISIGFFKASEASMFFTQKVDLQQQQRERHK